MKAIRRQTSASSDRFLGLFSSSADAAYGGIGGELEESDVLWTGTDSSAAALKASLPVGKSLRSGLDLSSSTRLRPPASILAALRDEVGDGGNRAFRNPSFLQKHPKASIFSSSSSFSSEDSKSPPSSGRMVPSVPKMPKSEYSSSMPVGKIRRPSAPMNVPIVSRAASRGAGEDGDEGSDVDEMLPPHEIVARRESPLTTCSVLEGAGRTLKGRDLHRVRNAVWRQTGFLD